MLDVGVIRHKHRDIMIAVSISEGGESIPGKEKYNRDKN